MMKIIMVMVNMKLKKVRKNKTYVKRRVMK